MDTIFFVVAKLGGLALRLETWLLIAALVALFARHARVQRSASGVLVGALLGIGGLPLGDMMLRPIEARVPMAGDPGAIDGIIVLGGGEDLPASRHWAQPEMGEGGDRYLAALALARRYPEARLLFTGGSGRLRDVGGGEKMTEADVAAQVFAAQGIAPERLLLESRARNTAENARLAHALAAPGAEERWALITSAFHMPRAVESFAAAGWGEVIPVPVDYRTRSSADALGWNLSRNLELMNIAIREWVGRAAYAATGR